MTGYSSVEVLPCVSLQDRRVSLKLDLKLDSGNRMSSSATSPCGRTTTPGSLSLAAPRRPTLGSPPPSKKLKLNDNHHGFSNNFTLNITAVKTVSPNELASRMTRNKPPVIVDCRSFMSYNMGHIQGALNINCTDRHNKKRLQQGKCGIAELLNSKDTRELLRKRHTRDIVVYDECSSELSGIHPSDPMHFALSSILRENRDIAFLKGGITDFRKQYQGLCENSVKSPRQNCSTLYSPTSSANEPDIETAKASPVLPFLYLGNERDAANKNLLDDLKITYVLNVTSHIPGHFENQGITYKRLPATDSGQQNLKQYFEEAFSFIDEARDNGVNILIHCHAGVSRSATITIAYIMKHTLMSMIDTYRYVKNKRAIISPNFNFMGQLLEFEQALNSGKTPRVLEPRLNGIESNV